ncbi:flippase [Methanobacterium sp.]|uniref:flippase n=1 Tax=Methanobacterium sp. TaxID=2164 RepID=UPI003C76F0BB
MSTIKRIAKNTGLLFISQIITYALAFVFMMYSARYLGVSDFGVLSFALAFSGIMVIFADLGLSSLMTREISRNKSLMEKYIKNIGLIKLILFLFTLIFSVLIVIAMGYTGKNIEIVILITLYTLFGSLSLMFYSLFQSYEKMEYQSLGQVLNSLLLLAGALFIIYNKMDILNFALLYFFVGLIVFVYSLFICGWKFMLPKIEIDLDFWKILIKTALPLSLISIFSIITFRIDTVLLSIIDGNTAVGIYNAAYRLIEVLIFIPAVFTASIYPVISRFHISSRESLKIAYKKSFKYLVILGLPIAVGVTILADKIILLIYGAGFTDSILALKILIWAIPLIFLTYLFGIIIISINKQNIALKIVIAVMTLNIVFNIIFIPSYGYVAASIITVITELISLGIIFHFLSRFICKIQIREVIVKPVVASLIMGLFILNVNLNLFLLIIAATFIYFISLVLLGTFSEDDFKMFKHIVNK